MGKPAPKSDALEEDELDEEENLEEDDEDEEGSLEPEPEEVIEAPQRTPNLPTAMFEPSNEEEHMVASGQAPQPGRGLIEPTVELTAKTSIPASQASAAFGGGGGGNFRALTGTPATKQQENCLEYLEKLRHTADASAYQIHIIRIAPIQWNGYDLGFRRVLERWALASFNEVVKAVQEVHGGGEYELRIITPSGAAAHQMKFDIDYNQYEPKIPIGARPATTTALATGTGRYPLPGGSTFAAGYAGLGGMNPVEAQEAVDARNEQQKLVAEKNRIKSHQELKRTKREADEEDEKYEERREAKMRAPIEEAKREAEAVRSEMRVQVDSLKTILESKLDNKKDDKSIELLMKAMETQNTAQIEAMKAQTMQQMETTKMMLTLITAVLTNNSSKPNESIEMMKSVMELVGQQLSGNKDSDSRELLKILAMKAVNQDSNQLKTMLDMMEKGREQTLELMEITRPSGAGEQVLDPEGGFFSNLGNLALHGVRRLVEGAAAPGGANKLAAAAARVFAPPGAMMPQSVGPIMEVVPQPVQHTRPATRQLPPPSVQTATVAVVTENPMQQPQPTRTAAISGMFNPVHFDAILDEATGAVLSGHQTGSAEPAQAGEEGIPIAPSPAAPAGGIIVTSDSTREHVTEALRIALDDLDNDRVSSDWVGYAAEKWGGRFIQRVASAQDDVQRMQIVFEACDQDVLGELNQRLQSNPVKRVKFAQDVRAVLTEYAGAVNAAG